MTKISSKDENSSTVSYAIPDIPSLLTLATVNEGPKLIFHLNGDVTWNDRIITGDEEFKEAVINFSNWIKKNRL